MSGDPAAVRLADAGWVWEGQGLDPGVHPSIFGVGEGADFFGLTKVRFMFHPVTELALNKLRDKKEVVCDISKWEFVDSEKGGSDHIVRSNLDHICAVARDLSRMSVQYRNVTGGFMDDMMGLMRREGAGDASCGRLREALKSHNPSLRVTAVVYTHELGEQTFWRCVRDHLDEVSLWVWDHRNLNTLNDDVARCRELFPGKTLTLGCYLRDYPSASPMPFDSLHRQWTFVRDALASGRIDAFEILGAVLIDAQVEQAEWVRDFIRAHS